MRSNSTAVNVPTMTGFMYDKKIKIQCFSGDPAQIIVHVKMNSKSRKIRDEEETRLDGLLMAMGQIVLDDKSEFISKKTNGFHYVIKFTGNHKSEQAIHALQHFRFTDKNMNQYQSMKFKRELENFRKLLTVRLVKKGKPIPSKGKLLVSSTAMIFQMTHSPPLHKIEKVQIKSKVYFCKENAGVVNEFEALSSELFIWLLGKSRVGKSRAVYLSGGERRGLRSSEVKNFVSVEELLEIMPISSDFNKKMIEGGCGKVEVANLVFADPDAHQGNIGFNAAKELTRIDFDRALFPLTCIYSNFAEAEETKNDGEIMCAPNVMFPIHADDIKTLPVLEHAKPPRGLNYLYMYAPKLLEEMSKDNIFLNDKWYTFLKYLLIDDTMYSQLVINFISSPKKQDKIKNWLIDRREKFRITLLSIPEFRDYVSANPQVIQKIIKEFEEISSDTNKMDNNRIKKTYDELYSCITFENAKIKEKPKVSNPITIPVPRQKRKFEFIKNDLSKNDKDKQPQKKLRA